MSLVMFLAAIGLAIPTLGFGAFAAGLIFAPFYNRIYARSLGRRGYSIIDYETPYAWEELRKKL